ncbi:MAG: glycyl-radical enzyme activating protein [Marinilabiliaceae bacterium]|jgi:pyruvate formate lyase activating enzyme|nr:glycyl-radical enzyme activating protein [Marinilabiliaceae bacterium]
MEGIIFNIKRYAIHDGPGIRVTFFMKGCPLSCWWCHNPEGISPRIEKVARIDRIGQKEFRVNEEVGKKYSVAGLLEIVDKERVFLEESAGGVTFSGGEPLMQSEFVIEAMKALRSKGIHTCLDTSGQADRAVIENVIPHTDLFLLDIKHVDSALHKKFTGVSNKRIFDNYDRLFSSGKDIFVRIPVIPGFNDDETNLKAIRDYLVGKRDKNLLGIDLLSYHRIGASKYKRFGMEFKMDGVEEPSVERMKELKSFFSEPGFKVKIGG